MQTFKTNFERYQKEAQLSRKDILELTDMNPCDLEALERDKCRRQELTEFCYKLNIAYTSVYSDGGFKTASVIEQYDSYPKPLQRLITKAFMRWVMDNSQERMFFSLRLSKWISKDAAYCTQLIEGQSAFNSELFDVLQKNLCAEADPHSLTKEDFYFNLAKIMFRMIANYNLAVILKHFKVPQRKVALIANCTPSGVGNWGWSSPTPIPDAKIEKIAPALGGFAPLQFLTHIVDPSELVNRKIDTKPLGAQLIDPPSQLDTKPAHKKYKVKINKPQDKQDSVDKQDKQAVNSTITLPLVSHKDVKTVRVNNPIASAFTDEVAFKMFNKLSDKDKEEIKSLIFVKYTAIL